MASIIYYCYKCVDLEQSILSLLDNTKIDLIDDILICADNDELHDIELPPLDLKIKILKTKNIGRSKAWIKAVEQAEGDSFIFIGGLTKFCQGWLEHILDKLTDNNIVSPTIYGLDVDLWALTDQKYDKFGWRWDFQLYAKQLLNDDLTIVNTSHCMAIRRARYFNIGGFDDGMLIGGGEDIEISYRNIAMGGICQVDERSIIGTLVERENNDTSLINYNRIINAWFPEYARYFSVYNRDIDIGKISNLIEHVERRSVSNAEIFDKLQPELFGVNFLKEAIIDKSIAIIAPGASLDFIDRGIICRHDVVIGVDYVGMLHGCDFVITDSTAIISELTTKYSTDKLILPLIISNNSSGTFEHAHNLYPKAKIFEMAGADIVGLSNNNPPFIKSENLALTALHLALYCEPKSIYLYGFDSDLQFGRSHIMTSRYYGDGKILPDNETTNNKYKYNEFLLGQLRNISNRLSIPVIRINHL